MPLKAPDEIDVTGSPSWIEGISIIVLSYIFIVSLKRLDSLDDRIRDNVTIYALHLGYGGIEQYISSLTKMIDKKITIISTYKLYEEPPFEYNNSKIVYT